MVRDANVLSLMRQKKKTKMEGNIYVIFLYQALIGEQPLN
jgi:hypothetical protein